MNQKHIVAGLFASLISTIPSTMYAEDCCLPCYTPAEPLCDSCAGYGEYAGVQLDCAWDVYTFGEFLYWAPIRSSGLVVVTNQNDPPVNTRKELSSHWGYRPAFRVGLGATIHCFDDWTFNLDYLRFNHHYRQTNSVTAPVTITTNLGTAILNFGLLNSFNYTSITTKSGFALDEVNLNIQRANYFGQTVILQPFFGLKWMRQKTTISQQLTRVITGVEDHQNVSLSLYAIGPDAGLNGSWLWCWGFRMIGKAQIGLIYSYKESMHQNITATNIAIQTQKAKYFPSCIIGYGGWGFGWGEYFCNNRYHVDIAATYDFWVNVSHGTSALTGFYGPNGVTYHGLVVHGQFDF